MSFLQKIPASRIPGLLRRCLLALGLVACAAGAEPTAGKIFLWEVKSPTNSVYVFGSLHAARPDFYPLPKAVEDAYRQADELAVEIDITDTSRLAKSLALMTYAPPDSLDHHVSPAVWKRVEAASQQAKQNAAAFKLFKPAVLASVLAVSTLQEHGYDASAGIDLHFLTSAHADGKRIVELETPDFQAGILGGLSDADGEAMLVETLDEVGTNGLSSETDQLAAAWKAGDDDAVAHLLREANKDEASQKFFARLFDERNPGMADKIAAIAAGHERALVVIGAGHLAGENSVLQLLKAKGLKVRQLP
jgi:uncharacterized protein